MWTILQIIPEMGAGGAERTTVEVAEAVVARGGRALVASAGGRLEDEVRSVSGEHVTLPLKTKNPVEIWRNAGRIAKLASGAKADLIHARSRAPAWSAYWAARRLKLPFVTTYHGIYNGKSPAKIWYNSIMARGDQVIANSRYTAEHLIRTHHTDAAKVTIIPRGVDLQKFDPDRVSGAQVAAVRESWGLAPSDTRPIILHAARLTRWKGQALAIDAAARLRQTTNAPFILALVGDAQGRDHFVAQLRDQIDAAGLAGCVLLPGHCADIPAALTAAAIVIQPSLEPEAFGRSAAEAQAMGKPVIAAAHGGLTEIIEDGITGLLVPPNDAEALKSALAGLLQQEPKKTLAMSREAILRARRLFAKESLQEATLSVYMKLIGDRA